MKIIKRLSPFICILLIFAIYFIVVGYEIHTYDIKREYEILLQKKPPVEIVYIDKEVEVIKEKILYYPIDTLTEEDFSLLCQLIYLEAGSENTTDLDRKLVGNVALNRVFNNYRNATSLKEVVFAAGQYSTASQIDLTDPSIEIPLSSVLAAYQLAIGNRYCPNNVIYQSQYKQGDGVWIKVNNHYYCYDKNIPIDESILIQDFIK